jgi:hypothetical protein
LVHRGNAFGKNTLLHALSDAGNVSQFETVESLWRIALLEEHKAVRFLHVPGDLGEQALGCEANRTAQRDADLTDQLSLLGRSANIISAWR